MSPVQLSFRADRAQSARAPRGVAPPSSGGGTGPLCRPPPPALGTNQELIQFPFSLFAAVTVALLQLADEFFSIALDPVHIVVGELSPPTADVTLYLDPLAFQYVFIHPFLLFVIKLTKICTWGANGSSWVRRISGPAVGTTSIGHRAFFIRRI